MGCAHCSGLMPFQGNAQDRAMDFIRFYESSRQTLKGLQHLKMGETHLIRDLNMSSQPTLKGLKHLKMGETHLIRGLNMSSQPTLKGLKHIKMGETHLIRGVFYSRQIGQPALKGLENKNADHQSQTNLSSYST
jgi:hypothetical protein